MFYLLQSLIMFAVIASNIAYRWTPNPWIPALLGAGLAYGLTRLLGQYWISKKHRAQ